MLLLAMFVQGSGSYGCFISRFSSLDCGFEFKSLFVGCHHGGDEQHWIPNIAFNALADLACFQAILKLPCD